MKTRKLRNIDISEISILFYPEKPAVPQARILVAKADSFLERPEVLEALRNLDKVVQGLKLQQKERELAQALQKEAEAQARKIAPRYRTRTYESFEDHAEHRNRQAHARQLAALQRESDRPLLDPTGKEYRRFGVDLF